MEAKWQQNIESPDSFYKLQFFQFAKVLLMFLNNNFSFMYVNITLLWWPVIG